MESFEEQQKIDQEKKEAKAKAEREAKEREEKDKKASKPQVPPKPSSSSHDVRPLSLGFSPSPSSFVIIPFSQVEETSLKPIITETLSCQFIKGQLQKCDLAGQVSFTGTIRKDIRHGTPPIVSFPPFASIPHSCSKMQMCSLTSLT